MDVVGSVFGGTLRDNMDRDKLTETEKSTNSEIQKPTEANFNFKPTENNNLNLSILEK